LLALVLEKDNAVDAWRELLGPMELDVAQIEAPDRSVTEWKHWNVSFRSFEWWRACWLFL